MSHCTIIPKYRTVIHGTTNDQHNICASCTSGMWMIIQFGTFGLHDIYAKTNMYQLFTLGGNTDNYWFIDLNTLVCKIWFVSNVLTNDNLTWSTDDSPPKLLNV